jgi:hypothetical protein
MSWKEVKKFLNEEIKDVRVLKKDNTYAVIIDKDYRYRNEMCSMGEIEQFIIITEDGESIKIDAYDSDYEYAELDLNSMNDLFIYKKLDVIFKSYKLEKEKKEILYKIDCLRDELTEINEKNKKLKKIYDFDINVKNIV